MTVVRPPRPDEWEAARELRLRALLDTPLAFLDTYEEAVTRGDDAWRERVAPLPTRAQFVAIADDGTWVGSMVVLTEADPPTLVGVFVDASHRGDGTAARLLDAVVAHVRGLGRTRLRLQVGEHNDRARRFYERMGFVATGDVELYPQSPEPEHEMIREL